MSERSVNMSNAVFLSIGLHIAILGSALSFAHYGGEPAGRVLPYITVMLTGLQGRGAGAAKPLAAKTAQSVPSAEQAAPVPQAREQPPLHDAMPELAAAEALPPPALSGAGGMESAAGPGAETAAAGWKEGPESEGSGYSPEQWQQVYRALERVKSYPRFARERGIEGTVLVRFKVLPSGTVETVNVVKSSGASVLDEASVTTVYRAAPMPFVNGWIEVPLSYVLK